MLLIAGSLVQAVTQRNAPCQLQPFYSTLMRYTHLGTLGCACLCCRTQNGQLYEPHHDYFSHPTRDANGGNRLATVLVS